MPYLVETTSYEKCCLDDGIYCRVDHVKFLCLFTMWLKNDLNLAQMIHPVPHKVWSIHLNSHNL